MSSLPEEVRELFEEEKYHQLATCSADGIPNLSNIGGKYIQADGKIVVVDNHMSKTKDNVLANPHVAILVRREKLSFQIKGVCRYVTSGPEYEEARTWMKAKGDKYPAKGALVITASAVYDSTTRETAGDLIWQET